MIVPFGGLPGFSLAAEVREVAAHYGVDSRKLRRGNGRDGPLIAQARHALFWKLSARRDVSAARIGQMLHCSAKTVREGIDLHTKRIAEFRQNSLGEAADAA